MTQEDKELLLQDLCARLPYGVKCRGTFCKKDNRCKGGIKIQDKDFIFDGVIYSEDNVFELDSNSFIDISSVKPYLRPMSSMTEEEIKEYKHLINRYASSNPDSAINMINWLNAHHFDYNGLIEKGLAIEVTKDNNPYE